MVTSGRAPDTMPGVLFLGSHDVAAHLTVAITSHERECRRKGMSVPAEFAGLVEMLANWVRSGQEGSLLADVEAARQSAAMTPALVTYEAAAHLLSVGVSTVKRLVRSGALTGVHVNGAARIRTNDLNDYVNQLATPASSPKEA